MPQSCGTAQPGSVSAKLRPRAGGAIEPETIASLSEVQSCLSNKPAARHAATCAGPVHSAVGRSRSTVCASSSGLNAGSRTVQAPTDQAQCNEYRPYRCDSGAAQRIFEEASNWCSRAPRRLLPSMVRYACGTAFGEAVVPEV